MEIIHDAIQEAYPDVKRIRNWRSSLAVMTHGGNDTRQVLYDLMMGRAYQCSLPDGQVSAPFVPTAEVRLRAAIFLHEQEFGRAVPQTEINKADQEARETAAIHALTDEELAAEAEKILAGRRARELPPGEFTPSARAAETVVDALPSLSLEECAQLIWDAPYEE